MKLATVLLAAMLTGCATMTPTQKRVATVVGSAVVIGAVAAHGSSDNNLMPLPDKPCPSGGPKSGVIYHC